MTAQKLTKKVRSSLGKRADGTGARICPQCETPMVATKVLKSTRMPGGMYWVCPKDNFRVKT